MGEKGMEPTGSVAGVANPQGQPEAPPPPPLTEEEAAMLAAGEKLTDYTKGILDHM